MKVHSKIEISHLRVYADGCSYEDKDGYLLIVTVHHLGGDEVWISGAKGTLTKAAYKDIQRYLFSEGIRIIRYEKSKQKKLFSRRFFTCT